MFSFRSSVLPHSFFSKKEPNLCDSRIVREITGIPSSKAIAFNALKEFSSITHSPLMNGTSSDKETHVFLLLDIDKLVV